MTYKAPTGPELSVSSAADVAVSEARAFGESGAVKVELARGTITQTRALMEGDSLTAARAQEAALASPTPSSTFCFGGQNANCSAAEQQHAKEILYAEGQQSAYLVTISGKSFAPQTERLPANARPVTGSTAVLLLDAHTGARRGLTIGAGTTSPPGMAELPGGVSQFTAAPQATAAQAASRGSHPFNSGSVKGTFTRRGEVIVFNSRGVFGRTKVRHAGQFEIASVAYGTYRVAGKVAGRKCPAKQINVKRGQETTVHLRC
ncbi:MAG: hypothetical protein ACHQHO_02675 [Solirubrobacterales bacterium]